MKRRNCVILLVIGIIFIISGILIAYYTWKVPYSYTDYQPYSPNAPVITYSTDASLIYLVYGISVLFFVIGIILVLISTIKWNSEELRKLRIEKAKNGE